MKIKRLIACNCAGSTFDHALAPITVFAGANKRGKTTRLNALAIGLCGQVPGIATKQSDIHNEFASGVIMTVTIDAIPYGFIVRSYKMQSGSVKLTEDFGGCFLKGWTAPTLLFNAKEFLDSSETKRIKAMFKVASTGDKRADVAARIVHGLKAINVEDSTPESEVILNELVAEVQDILERGAAADLPVNELVEEVCTNVRQKKLAADENAKRMARTGEGIAQVTQEQQSPDPAAEHKLREARANHRTKFGELTERETELKMIVAKVNAAEHAERETKTEAGLRSQLETLERSKKALDETLTGPSPTAPTEEHDRLAEIQRERQTSRDAAVLLACRSKGAVDDAKAELRTINSMTVCKECGADVSQKRETLRARCQERLAGLELELKRLSDGEAEAERELAKAKQDRQTELTKLQARRSEVDLHAANRRRQLKLAEDITRVQTVLSGMAAKSELAKSLPQLRTQLETAQLNVNVCKEANQEAFDECSRWEAQHNRLIAARMQAQQRERVAKEARLHEANSKVVKAAVAVLDDLRGTMVAESIDPLLDRVNALCEPVLQAKVAYLDGCIGFLKPDGKLVDKTKCGAEIAIIAAAVQVVLSVDSDIKLLVLDELGRIDADRKRVLMQTVLGLIQSGQLDQAVMCDVDPQPYLDLCGENLSVIRL